MNFARKTLARASLSTGFLLWICCAHGGPAGQPMESLQKPTDPSSTNLQQFSTAQPLKEELLRKKMNERLFRPFKAGDDPLSTLLPAPAIPTRSAPTAAEKRRMKEWMEKNQDWILMNPDEWQNDPEAEKIMQASEEFWEGEEGKSMSALERLHNRQKDPLPATNQMRSPMEFGKAREERDRQANSAHHGVFAMQTNAELKATFTDDNSGSTPKLRPIFSEVFRSANEIREADVARTQERSAQFHEILAPRSAPSGSLNILNSLTAGDNSSASRISSALDSPMTRGFSSSLLEQPNSALAVPRTGLRTHSISESSSGGTLQPSLTPVYTPVPPPEAPPVLPIPRRRF